jgi:tRNA pseudouridine55 synthase
MKSEGPQGFLVLDKPAGPTSRDVVNRVLRSLPPRTRIGHTGTLDPLATGVLVVAIGAATRLTSYVQSMSKIYQSKLRLGQVSDTDDAAGKVETMEAAEVPSRSALQSCLESMCGEIEQLPPAFSAAKLEGRRAYDLARRGKAVSLKPRRVQVHTIEVVNFEYPHLDLVVKCGKGTYIRALARDIGQKLGCGAMVESLRRTAVGPFTVEQAIDLERADEQARQHLLPLALALADLPVLELCPTEIERFRHGQRIELNRKLSPSAVQCAVYDEANNLVGIGSVEAEGFLKPVKVL